MCDWWVRVVRRSHSIHEGTTGKVDDGAGHGVCTIRGHKGGEVRDSRECRETIQQRAGAPAHVGREVQDTRSPGSQRLSRF